MNTESKLSRHWTEDELIEHLYGVGPGDGHMDVCGECQARLASAQTKRRALEADLSASSEEASYDFLMEQRRRIYARVTRARNWWSDISVGRWASASATLLVVAGGFVVYDQRFRQEAADRQVSDVQLARDVSCMAADSEPPSTAPLRALFEE